MQLYVWFPCNRVLRINIGNCCGWAERKHKEENGGSQIPGAPRWLQLWSRIRHRWRLPSNASSFYKTLLPITHSQFSLLHPLLAAGFSIPALLSHFRSTPSTKGSKFNSPFSLYFCAMPCHTHVSIILFHFIYIYILKSS